jgi:outer membrane protein OmpA-like peptidoglycan-associated protein
MRKEKNILSSKQALLGKYRKFKGGNPMLMFRHVRFFYVMCILILLLGATPLLAKDGYLRLHVTPKQAYVYIDDVPLGWGSGLFWAIPGEHTLAVYNYGYKSYSTKFTSESGKTSSLSVALEPVPGNVSGPWGRIQLEGPSQAAVLLNGKTPDFFVGHVDEFNNNIIWKQELLVPPGNHQLTVSNYGGAEVYSGPVSVSENQRVILFLNKSGEKRTTDWPRGKTLSSLPRFKAGIASATVAVAKPTSQLTSSSSQIDCGGTAQLKWSTSEAPRVEIGGLGEVAASGEQAVQPKQTTAYKLTAAGPGGVADSEVTVNVNSNIQGSLSVTPAEIRYHKVGDRVEQQGSASLSWSASGADTATLDPFGPVSPTGNRTIQATPQKTSPGPIDETVNYTFHSSNACGGSDSRTASLHIVGSIEVPQGATVEALEVKLSLNSIYFPTSLPTVADPKGGLVPSQQQRLQELVTNFKQYVQLRPDAHLILQAHADKRGSVKYNMALSERRAGGVRSFLVEQGIAESNIETKAFGKEQNLDAAAVKQLTEQNPNLTPEDRMRVEKQLPTFLLANNRRVDIVLSTTGQKSLQYFPYNSEDLKVLLGAPPKAEAAPRKAKAKVKK